MLQAVLKVSQIYIPQFFFLTPTMIIATALLLISLGTLIRNMIKLAKNDIAFYLYNY